MSSSGRFQVKQIWRVILCHECGFVETKESVCVCGVWVACVDILAFRGWRYTSLLRPLRGIVKISGCSSSTHRNTKETTSCMRNRGLKRPAPSEILLPGTVSEEEWPIPDWPQLTHWKLLKCPMMLKSDWLSSSWSFQKVKNETSNNSISE